MKNKYKYFSANLLLAALIIIFIGLFFVRPATKAEEPAQYTIEYVTPLSVSQKTEISRSMISQFSPACRPNRITVGVLVSVETDGACLSGQDLKNISDRTLNKIHQPDEVKVIKLNGKQIYPN